VIGQPATLVALHATLDVPDGLPMPHEHQPSHGRHLSAACWSDQRPPRRPLAPRPPAR
jgi:hypothetical protein